MTKNIQEELLKNALLGTNRYTMSDFGLIQTLADKLEKQAKSREEVLLGVAYTQLLYQEAGKIPVSQDVEVNTCPPEKQPLHSENEANLLKNSFTTNDTLTQQYLLERCYKQQQLVRPDLVVFCLNKALSDKKKMDLYLKVVGELGHWLCQLNPEWTELLAYLEHKELTEEAWYTGIQAQRVQYLQKVRQENPAEAIALLEKTIYQENAAQRQDFVSVLEDGLSINDEPFLMKLKQDKSKHVRQLVQELLKKIEGGTVQTSYLDYLCKTLALEKKTKGIGFTVKLTFAINSGLLPTKEIFDTGIDNISNTKNITDQLYCIAQMLAFVSPELLAEKLSVTETQLLEALLNRPAHEKKFLLNYLIKSTLLFEYQPWALHLVKQEGAIQPTLFALLPEDEKWNCLPIFLKNGFRDFMLYLLDLPYFQLPAKAAMEILSHLHKHPFELDTQLYKKLAFYLPNSLLEELYAFAQEDHQQNYQRRHFQTQIGEMITLLETLKDS